MKNAQGFTLFELIITIILSAILSAIVVEIVAGPIRSYFWVSNQSDLFEIGTQVMGSLSQELSQASNIEILQQGKALSYRKIVHSGVMLSTTGSDILIAGDLPAALYDFQNSNQLFLSFPTVVNAPLYPVKLLKENKILVEDLMEKVDAFKGMKHLHFQLITAPIQIEFNPVKNVLEKIIVDYHGKTLRSLLGNQIEQCQFIANDINQDKTYRNSTTQILVSLILKDNKQQAKMAQTFVSEEVGE